VIRGFANLLERRDDEKFRLEAAARIQQAAAQLETSLDAVLARLDAALGPDRPAGAPRRIVVVDDDRVVRELLVATLDADTFEVVEAADGNEALALLDPVPALVILDWRVPGGGGAEILARLKQRAPSLPVIVLTGDAAAETRDSAGAGGADAYMTKPFSPLELLDAVERLVARDAPPADRPADGGHRSGDAGR
jgi:CheY-like chemotaxis protein